jgi:hypothetical protein
MKLFIFALIIILTQRLSSQDSTSQQIDLTGKFALQFQIAENFKLTSFQGSIISGKYNFSNSLALRFGVSFNARNDKYDQDNSNVNTNNKYLSVDEIADYSVQIKPQLLYSSSIVEDVSFYWGGGLTLIYEHNAQNSKSTVDTLLTTYEYNSSGFGYGLEAVVGVEWFVKKNISLSAEYGLQVSHIKVNIEQKRVENGSNILNKNDNSYTRSNGNLIRMGLSVYF